VLRRGFEYGTDELGCTDHDSPLKIAVLLIATMHGGVVRKQGACRFAIQAASGCIGWGPKPASQSKSCTGCFSERTPTSDD
jgi:hypothetical protein